MSDRQFTQLMCWIGWFGWLILAHVSRGWIVSCDYFGAVLSFVFYLSCVYGEYADRKKREHA